MQPVHGHPHRVWLVPGSGLGRWAIWVFLASLTALALAIVSREPWVDLFGHSEEGWVLFWKLLPLGVGMTLGGVSGVMSVVALVRDHALLLVIPAVLGLIIGMVGLGGVLIPQ